VLDGAVVMATELLVGVLLRDDVVTAAVYIIVIAATNDL